MNFLRSNKITVQLYKVNFEILVLTTRANLFIYFTFIIWWTSYFWLKISLLQSFSVNCMKSRWSYCHRTLLCELWASVRFGLDWDSSSEAVSLILADGTLHLFRDIFSWTSFNVSESFLIQVKYFSNSNNSDTKL